LSSNAIALAKNGGTVGMGAGQVNRVGAVEIAINKLGTRLVAVFWLLMVSSHLAIQWS